MSDRAERPSLPGVTLVAVTSVALRATVQALHRSMSEAQFGQVLLLSDQFPPTNADPTIRWQKISPLRSRADYSGFMLRELVGHIDTDHALCVQWDGFVLNGAAWNPRFLEFDYIGAVWPHFDDAHNVGNGGFSLRSRRLLSACRDLHFDGSAAEDVVIGRLHREDLEKQGLRIAPERIARLFSYERSPPTGREFGFHGAFNLVRLLPSDAVAPLFRTLEPGMLSRGERAEIMRWSIRHRQWFLASQMAFRLL